jgi:hypothetical protein
VQQRYHEAIRTQRTKADGIIRLLKSAKGRVNAAQAVQYMQCAQQQCWYDL